MATEVELKSILTAMTSLTDLNETTNERRSPRTYISPLSDASNKASELSNLPSGFIVEEKSRLGSALKPTTTSTSQSQPRISPKPYKSLNPYEIRKLPITASKQNSLKSSLQDKPGQTAPDEELSGNASSIDQKLNDTDIRGSNNLFTAKKVFYSMPETNILISDTTCNMGLKSLSRPRGTEIAGELKPVDLSYAKEYQSISQSGVVSASSPISQKLEDALYSEMSGSTMSSIVPVEPYRTGEKAYSCMNDKSKDLTKSVNAAETSPAEVQLRAKRRPVSAVFLESSKDSKLETRDISEEVSLGTTDKSWVRKPRPLSVDLTAKFENKFTPPQKRTVHASEETKENVPVSNSANRLSLEQTEIISKDEGMQVKGRSESFKSNFKSNGQNDYFQLVPPVNAQLLKDANGFSSETTNELLISSSVESRCRWESKYKCGIENKRKTDVQVEHESGKHNVAPNDASRSNKGWASIDPTEVSPVLIDEKLPSNLPKEETKSPGSSIQRRISLLLAVSNSSPVNTELASPEKDKGTVDIQKRIKEFTTENVEIKPGDLQKSLKSRPLSADLTKMFSTQTPANETKSQSVLEHTESPKEAQGKQENVNEKNKEEKLYGRTGHGDPLTERIPWKINQSANRPGKEDQFERESFSKELKNVNLSNRNCVSKTNDLESELSHAVSGESVDFKTVRATLLEHNVQWHSASETYPVVDPTWKLTSKNEKNSGAVDSLGLEGKPLQRRNLEDKVHLSQAGEAEKGIAYEQNRKSFEAALDNYSSHENLRERTSKSIEDTLNFQRIEPKYEIIHTVGERARSESITLAAEDKAVTLRSRKSFHAHERERKKSNENVVHSDLSYNLPYTETDSLRDVTQFPVSKNISETASNKPGITDPRTVAVRSFAKQDDNMQPVKFQSNQSVKLKKTASFTHIDKQSGIARNEIMTRVNNFGEKENIKGNHTSHALDKYGTSKVSDYFSNNIVIPLNETLDFGNNLDKRATSTDPNFNKSHSSDFLVDSRLRAELIAVDKGESRVFGLKQYDIDNRMRKDIDGVRVNENTKGKSGYLELEGKVRKVSGTTTDLSIEQSTMISSSKDANALEKSKRLVQDNTNSPIRRAHFMQSTEDGVLTENTKCQENTGSKEISQDTSYFPRESMRRQDLIPEPKATYFAVTCHFLNKKKDISESPLHQNDLLFQSDQEISAPLEDSSRKNMQTTKQLSRKSSFIYDKDISPETISKHSDKKQEWAIGYFSKQYIPSEKMKPSEDYSGCRTLDNNLGNVPKSNLDVDALLKERRMISDTDTGDKILSDNEAYVRPLQKDGKEFVWRKNDETCSLLFEPKDSYRYSVLDIDELMASYKPESLKVSGVESKQHENQNNQSPFMKERSKSLKNYADKFHSSNWKSPKDSLQSSPSSAELSNKPIHIKSDFSQESNKKPDSYSQNMNKQKSKDVQISQRNCEKLDDPFSDQTAGSLSEAHDKKKLNKIADEEQVIGLSRTQQYDVKYDKESGSDHRVSLHPESDASLNSISSRVAADKLLQKALSRKCQQTEKSVESSSQNNIKYSSEVLTRKTSAIRTSDGTDFDKSKSSVERSVSISHLGKNRPARTKDIAYLIQEDKEKRREEQPQQNLHLASVEMGVKKRDSTRRERGSTDDKMQGTEKEWARSSDQRSGIREASATPFHRRSRSLRERRAQPQPVDSCFYDQLKQCFARPSPTAKDTDTLVREADSQYGTWSDEGLEDSYVPVSPSSDNARKQPPHSRLSTLSFPTEVDYHDSTKDQRHRSLDRSSVEMDSSDSTDKPASASPVPGEDAVDFSFLVQTSVLDSSALKNRVQLSRRSQRRAPTSHSLRRSRVLRPDKQLTIMEDTDSTWMFKDSTEEKHETQVDSIEEEKPQKSAVQPQRLPVFPGMDPSVLKAQLRKRQESDGTADTSGSAKLLKSPKSPLQQGVLGGRPLPSPTEENGSEEASPQWLKELKSKKRQSQYENQA